MAGPIKTDIYQMQLLHKQFCQALNVVIIVKTNQTTGASAHVCLFSSDLALTYEQMIDYYSLRFQIEFNFRDAKQFWGLDDFMNVTSTDPRLRQYIHAATTKIESYNNFLDWIAFGGHGILTPRDPVEQEKRIKYMDLVANAVMLHNVVDMTDVLHQLAQEGYTITSGGSAQSVSHPTHQTIWRLCAGYGRKAGTLAARQSISDSLNGTLWQVFTRIPNVPVTPVRMRKCTISGGYAKNPKL